MLFSFCFVFFCCNKITESNEKKITNKNYLLKAIKKGRKTKSSLLVKFIPYIEYCIYIL